MDALPFNIAGYAAFWAITAIALGLFGWRAFNLIHYLSLGRKGEKTGNRWQRALKTLITVFIHPDQVKNLTPKDRAGILHGVFPIGFLVFVVYYLLFVVIAGGFGLSGLKSTPAFVYFGWAIDIISPLVIIAALWAIARRYIARPTRLEGEQSIEALVILLVVVFIPATLVAKQSLDIAAGSPPAGLNIALPPLSSFLSRFFGWGNENTPAVSAGLFWVNWGLVMFALVFAMRSRLLHIPASLANTFFRLPPPKGVLSTIDLEKAEKFGAAAITDFTEKQLLDLYSCVRCGKCQDACPATRSGKELNPKNVIQDLKKHFLDVAPGLIRGNGDGTPALAGGVISLDAVWACTTCRACDDICPVYVEHIDKIIDLRRNLVMEQGQPTETAGAALAGIEERGHPWRGATASRTDWAQGLNIKTLAEDNDIDILLWVGCTGALDERSIQTTRALAGLLRLAGVKFGILGGEEGCCGEPARRLGNEYLFQTQAQKNIEVLNRYGIKRIVTACPHGFHTLKNEYPRFGGRFEVIHHTELIASLIKEGRLKPGKAIGGTATYHDPCYLGRYNDVYKQPRQVIGSLPGLRLVEMAEKGSKSFCCGGGGGRMWQEESTGRRISGIRLEQGLETGADIIVTACPFCRLMLDDAARAGNVQEKVKVVDIAELVSMGISQGTLPH